ncbi:MAG: hypothetical protein HUJ26_00085 [Planctomycetaceae bacterium]|nr:hypothetical protein [Planctomycetaceae bacterium]
MTILGLITLPASAGFIVGAALRMRGVVRRVDRHTVRPEDLTPEARAKAEQAMLRHSWSVFP